MEKDTVLSPGQNHTIAFSNVDHVVTLTLDNSKVFVFDYDDGLVPDVRSFDTSKIRFGGSRISATFENIEIFHDIYYTELMNDTWGTTKPIQLGNTDYFMLGDNSRNSNDSRVWKFVPEKNIVGKAFLCSGRWIALNLCGKGLTINNLNKLVVRHFEYQAVSGLKPNSDKTVTNPSLKAGVSG